MVVADTYGDVTGGPLLTQSYFTTSSGGLKLKKYLVAFFQVPCLALVRLCILLLIESSPNFNRKMMHLYYFDLI